MDSKMDDLPTASNPTMTPIQNKGLSNSSVGGLPAQQNRPAAATGPAYFKKLL